MNRNSSIRMLTAIEVDAYVEHLARNEKTPGVGLPPISNPFPRNYFVDVHARRASARKRWALGVEQLGWERVWGVFVGEKIVGEVSLSSARLIETQLHRAILGMGLEPEYRGCGLGSALLVAAIGWAKDQRSLAWIDLGVLAHNAAARRLYGKFGFIETGRCADSFRVDGVSVDDIQMTLNLNNWCQPTL